MRFVRFFGILSVFVGFITFLLLRPLKETTPPEPGYKPLRNDLLAAKFQPQFAFDSPFGQPQKLYYRMATGPDQKYYIAYHPWYSFEENSGKGIGARFSRMFYTGGLGLKDIIFGPHDIELIEIILDKKLRIVGLEYEKGKNYSAADFRVIHEKVTETFKELRKQNACFRVNTWNHMVEKVSEDKCISGTKIPLFYFEENVWQAEKMVKSTEAILRRNRAHKHYERIPAI